MSEEEFDELLNLMSENNLTQHGADTLYGEIVSREINARLEIERLNKELQNLEKLNNANYQSFIEVNNIINELEKMMKKEAEWAVDSLRSLKVDLK